MGKYGFFLWGLQVHFYLNLQSGNSQNLRRSIKSHGEIVILKFHFPKNRKRFIRMFLGLMEIVGGVSIRPRGGGREGLGGSSRHDPMASIWCFEILKFLTCFDVV